MLTTVQIRLSDCNNGGAVVAEESSAVVTILDDGDTSVPGKPSVPVALSKSGGRVELQIVAPEDTGGATLQVTRMQLYMRLATGKLISHYTGTPGRVVVGGLSASTQYTFVW